MNSLERNSQVALLEGLPAAGLACGQTGTIVAIWEPGVYEVQFTDPEGNVIVLVALKASQVAPAEAESSRGAGAAGGG
jgi:hypothetical protein